MATMDLLFEIGVEEMPSGPLYAAARQLEGRVPEMLSDAHLEYAQVRVLFTPRRLVVAVEGLADTQPDITVEHRGPAAKIAFDESGNLTPAGAGFARGKGADPAALEVRDVEGTQYVFASVTTQGQPTEAVLAPLLSHVVAGIDWPKSQRWGSGDVRFIRPVRWMLALFGSQVIPVQFGDVVAGSVTYGHRFLSGRPIEVTSLREYPKLLSANHVVVDQAQRREMIVEAARHAAARYGTVLLPENVLAEVVNLTESPNALLGTFDEEFLRVPREILEYAMSSHQRYFAIERPDGSLDNHFVVISNGSVAAADEIVRGHERVVRARLADAAFFFDEDCKVPLTEWRQQLGSVVFQDKLGTVLDKAVRVESLAGALAASASLSPEEAATALRAAHLCKADLVTSAVVEFTNLQGVMGAHYARAAGESDAVATAIYQHYQPRYAGDALPATPAGQIVAAADKLDTICSIFAAGKAPRGTSDPFALRRAAIGVLQIAMGPLKLDVRQAVATAFDTLADVEFDRASVESAVVDFIAGRLETILRDRGYTYDTVAAVLAVQSASPSDAADRCRVLQQYRDSNDSMADLATAFGRAVNLSDAAVGTTVSRDSFTQFDEDLDRALSAAEQQAADLMARAEYDQLLGVFATLRTPIDAFFENVMVMDSDPVVRANRLALLNRFVALFHQFADFSLVVS